MIDLEQVEGMAVTRFSNYSMVHNTTVMINETEYPALQVTMHYGDPVDQCLGQHGFSWECTNFTSELLTLQLSFDNPLCVGASTQLPDTLTITVFN